MAEAMKNTAEEPKKLDIQDEDIDALMEAFQEADEEKAKGPSDEEKERAAEFRAELMKLIELEAAQEVQYLLENRQTMLGGDEMISMVIDLALERGGVKKDAKPETLEAFMANSELRAKAKENLLMALQAKMLDSDVGNDQEKVSKLEKAITALEG